MATLLNDLKYAFRMLVKAPADRSQRGAGAHACAG